MLEHTMHGTTVPIMMVRVGLGLCLLATVTYLYSFQLLKVSGVLLQNSYCSYHNTHILKRS